MIWGDYAAHSKSLTHSNVDLKHLFNLEDLATNYKLYLWCSNHCPPVFEEEKIKTTCFAADLGESKKEEFGQAALSLHKLKTSRRTEDPLKLIPIQNILGFL